MNKILYFLADNRFFFLVVLPIIAVILTIWIFWPKPNPLVDVAKLIEEAKKQVQQQYQQQINGKDTQLKNLKNQLAVSESKYIVLVNKYANLQKEKENVKPAQSNKELVDRFTALGFAPVSSDSTGRGVICFDSE